MRTLKVLLVLSLCIGGCHAFSKKRVPRSGSLAQARQAHQTKLRRSESGRDPVAQPPAGLFRVVTYPSPAGNLAAYLSPAPHDGKKFPAIIWLTGGFSNSIGETAWQAAPPANDQSASAFRQAGIIMMYPSLRGGNQNPNARECLYGEVDDVLAAAQFLAAQDYVDPARIYLGGHSTGGTLALLAAECSDRFRAVFAFGPVADTASYGQEDCPFDLRDKQERELRAPGLWLHCVRSRTFVLEGSQEPSNREALREMRADCRNARVSFHEVPGTNHFSILASITGVLARKIVQDTGAADMTLTAEELSGT